VEDIAFPVIIGVLVLLHMKYILIAYHLEKMQKNLSKYIERYAESKIIYFYLHRDLTFPSENENPLVISFISSLLKRSVPERSCTIELIKQHEFLDEFKWVNALI
jgi:hypothetical protein